MRGFMSVFYDFGWKGDHPERIDPYEKIMRMKKAGFIADRENDMYIKEGFGAFKTNVLDSIESIDDFRNRDDEYSKELIRLIDEEGYEFVLGPPAPGKDGSISGKGLYCSNYKEILKRQKEAKSQDDDAR